MKNKIFNNKLLSILFIFLLVVFIFTSSVFATDELSFVDTKGDTIVVSLLPYDCNINSSNGWLYKNNGLFFFLEDNSYCYIKNGNGIYISGSYRRAACRDGVWDISDVITSTPMVGITSEFSYYTTPVYSDINKNSISVNSTGEDFFLVSPQGITKTLVEETEKVQVAEQLKIMIVGFLKYLIVLVISLIAFWKGWQFLSTQLKKA